MSIIGKSFRAVLLLCGLFMAGSLYAQATRTWISGVGDDANPCSRTAPCKTFAGAISKTANGGVIDILDPGGFGALTITKSITLENVGAIGGVLVSGTNGFVVQAGQNDVVNLRGLSFEGLGTGLSGIKVNSVGELIVERCDIHNFTNYGIDIEPNLTVSGSTSTMKLTVRDTTIHDSGTAPTTSGGIYIAPGSNVSVNAHVEHTRIVNGKGFGIEAQGAVKLALFDSLIGNNAGNGVVATSASTATTLLLDRDTIDNNGAGGVVAQGAGALINLSDSSVTGNVQGLQTAGGGSIVSFGNNRNLGNNVDGTPTKTNSLQ